MQHYPRMDKWSRDINKSVTLVLNIKSHYLGNVYDVFLIESFALGQSLGWVAGVSSLTLTEWQ